jgi:hypothetical protein
MMVPRSDETTGTRKETDMKFARFFATASTADSAKMAGIETIKSFGLDHGDFTFVSAEPINATEYEVTFTGSANNLRKLRRALSEGDAE